MSKLQDATSTDRDSIPFVTRKYSPNDPCTKVVETHPAYGVVGISRVSGRGKLFASDTVHQHYISLRIKEASRHIDNLSEHIMGRKELIEINMTEAQFAQMITQPNVGDGVPCTIHRVAGDEKWGCDEDRWGGRPQPPEPEPFLGRFKADIAERGQSAADAIHMAKAYVNELLDGVSKPNQRNLKELLSKIETAERQFEHNLPYVVERMGEAMEKRLSQAVVEFECYVSQSLMARGLEAAISGAPRLALPAPKGEAEGGFLLEDGDR